MKLIMDYQCDNTIPTEEEIRQCMDIASAEHCIVRLNWFVPYSGPYKLLVKEGMTLDDCKAKLPNVYPV